MSAHCNRCGGDITYGEGTWPIGDCERCELQKKYDTLLDAVETYLLWEPRRAGHSAAHDRLSRTVSSLAAAVSETTP